MALRNALVIDKWRRCAPPDKRRRRAFARLLYFIRFTASPNINLTQIYKTKPYNKNSPCGRGAAPLNRFRPAPLFPARRISFFLPYILFRMYGFFVDFCCVRFRFVEISGHIVVISVTKSVLHFSCVRGIVHASVKGRSENFVKIPPDMSKNLCFYG